MDEFCESIFFNKQILPNEIKTYGPEKPDPAINETNENGFKDNCTIKLKNKGSKIDIKRKYLLKLLGFSRQKLAEYLIYNRKKFLEILEDSENDLNTLSLLFDVISKACSGMYSTCNKYISHLVQFSSLWLNILPSVFPKIIINDSECLNSLFAVAEMMYASTLNAYIIIHIEKIIEAVPKELDVEVKSKLLKLKERERDPWNDIDDCRSSESVFVVQSDLTNPYYLISRKDSICGNCSVSDYLDCYFILIKEAIINHYRKLVQSYWNHHEEKSVLDDNIIQKQLFLDDGVHLIVKLSFLKEGTQQFQPGMELCLSTDEFDTLEFASVLSVENNLKDSFLEVKLITCNANISIKEKKCIIVESIKDGNFYSKILCALKDQKDLAFENLIVKEEKSLKPPKYINSSTIMEFTPLSNSPADEWFETENQNENKTKKLKIKVLNKTWPVDKFCISPQEVNMIKEIFQRELALVKADDNLCASLCLNIIKILEFNRAVWQKGDNCPILILCNSEKMIEDMSVECVNISKRPIMLHDEHKLEKDNKQLKRIIKEHGKYIEKILNKVDIGNRDPLEVLKYEEILKFNDCYILLKQNKILEWLCLTKDTFIAYEYFAEEFNCFRILENECYFDKHSSNYFHYIANNMFNIKDEMSKEEANDVSDIWSLDLLDRWRLVRYWKNSIIDGLERDVYNEKQHYYQLLDVLDSLCCKFDCDIIKDASIILATSKTALNNIDIFNSIKPRVTIVMVLEANKIPEPYLIPFLHSNIEHLILFGSPSDPLVKIDNEISASMYGRLIANHLPYSEWIDTFKNKDKIRLTCGHTTHYPSDNANFKCMESIYYMCKCGKQVCIPCCQQNEYKCDETITIRLSCDHSVSIKCTEKDTFDLKCNKRKDVLLPCEHRVTIACVELKEKRQDYFSNGCYKRCNTILNCGHKCTGICSNCKSISVHEGCKERCQTVLNCGHQCKDKCGVPCPPCSLPCDWECSHKACDKLCGDLCKKCYDQCAWACSHYRCSKQCWEECDRGLCERDCPLTLTCGHRCVGICGETCPSLCSVCNPEMYENYVLPECGQILELNCGHMFNRITLISTLDLFQNSRPVCPLCNIPIKNKGFIGTYIKKWHILSLKKKDYILKTLNDGIRSICHEPKLTTIQYNYPVIGSMIKEISKKKNLSVFILAKTHILYIIQLNNVEKEIRTFINLEEHNVLLNKCIRMRTWLARHWFRTTFKQIEEISWEIYCMRLLCMMYKKKLRTKKFISNKISEVFLSCDRIIKHLQKKEPYSEKYKETLKQHLAKMNELDQNLEERFLKPISPITQKQFHKWLSGKINKQQIIWKKDLILSEREPSKW
ncbi:NFX1-type zinc finger-containing protein 1-like [Centruroides vittatus]|uniref:NFX1-type zinc finger-containing protein 1-like n=1 Tax=Centruroides vittatus TaxID=120091 RepID=UPI00350EDED3